MTGRKLYDALTDAWAAQPNWQRNDGLFLQNSPPAWGFLHPVERDTFNSTARALTTKKRK
ncbi:MAG: hypothetical protein NUW01_18240 [Gemmatimonadaceae bacterium]|nr:hypothetical protein [Gemmatimonadaceae bacterium]